MKPKALNFIFVMLLLGIVALTIGSSALLRVSVCMLCMFLLALLSVLLALATARVRVTAKRDVAQRGERVEYQVDARFSSPLPVGEMALEWDRAPGRNAETISIAARPFRTQTARGAKLFAHRGVYSLGEGRLYATDLFDLCCFSRRVNAENALVTVLPRARAISPMRFSMGESGPEVSRRYPDDASSPSGVREWREGDLLKRVHWKLTMKMYDPSLRNLKPMVRTYDEAARPDILLIPDLTRVDAVTERALSIEDAICEACLSIARAQLEGENPVRLLLGGSEPAEVEGRSDAELTAFSNALARARFDDDAPYEQMLIEAARRLDRTGALILITSRLTLRVADCAIRLRRMSGLCVAVVWITDTRRAEAQALISRLSMADVIARRDNPFQAEEQ